MENQQEELETQEIVMDINELEIGRVEPVGTTIETEEPTDFKEPTIKELYPQQKETKCKRKHKSKDRKHKKEKKRKKK